jgi:hypothetical protein
MQNQLVRGNKRAILFKGYVYKQGQKANKKVSKRLMVLSPLLIQWFHNQEEFQNNALPLGVIRIENIYKCSHTLMRDGTFDFDISVISYTKKGVEDKDPRTIKFGCLTEMDRHQWISRIEFLRTKSMYDNYVNKFVQISFPLKKGEDQEDDSEQQIELKEEKLQNFGRNFKMNAKINLKAIQSKFGQFNKTNRGSSN